MTFKFFCTCGQKVSATDDMIGSTATCPRCGSNMVVARPEDPSPPPPPPLSSSLPPPPPPPPMTVVPRPVGLLIAAAGVALLAFLGTSAFLLRGHLGELVSANRPLLIGVPIGILVGSAIAAIFLRLAVRIVARFNFAFLEAWLVAICVTALSFTGMAPLGLIQIRLLRPEEAVKLAAIMGGIGFLLTLAAYSFLIRNALGRPIGIGRGILTYLLQSVFLGVLGGIIGVIGALTMHPWR